MEFFHEAHECVALPAGGEQFLEREIVSLETRNIENLENGRIYLGGELPYFGRLEVVGGFLGESCETLEFRDERGDLALLILGGLEKLGVVRVRGFIESTGYHVEDGHSDDSEVIVGKFDLSGLDRSDELLASFDSDVELTQVG
jgi:hypothetical protein